MQFSEAMIGRLALYRRTLRRWQREGRDRAFSHEISAALNLTAAQVRRDLMQAGCTGSPAKGYDSQTLLERFSELLDPPEGDGIVLVGVGHLGKALLSYLGRRHPQLVIRQAFDSDPEKCGRHIGGVPVHPIEELERHLMLQPLSLAVLSVPAEHAQELADRLVRCGVHAIVNFAPLPLRVPPEVFVEDVDIAVSLEKAAFYAQQHRVCTEESR
jgi:redox-sensing transcriptional repressor